ncbi:hypothetical protein [Streptomyces sp. NPDC085596]|uniref:hypothetical protein n=1 Tax=Streptomyces sp. NPDC085596 TaxID=3365731 RepID=UPI0037D0C86A
MSDTTTQPFDLDTIAPAIAAYQQHPDLGFACCSAHPVADAAAAMADEIRRLRAGLAEARDQAARTDREFEQVIRERDNLHDIADSLAYAVAPENVIGEHSSMNDPWENALDLITPAAEVDKLRRQISAVLPAPVDRAAVLREAADVAESFDIDASPQSVGAELRRMADAIPADELSVDRCDTKFVGGGQCTKPAGHRPPGSDAPCTPRYTADTRVSYFVQSRPTPSQPWQQHGLRYSWESKRQALGKLAWRREQQPSWEHRLMERTTTVTERPTTAQ